jgi:hypothetical protein
MRRAILLVLVCAGIVVSVLAVRSGDGDRLLSAGADDASQGFGSRGAAS